MRMIILLTLFSFQFLNSSYTQTRIEIRGRVTDTLSAPLALATIIILDATDSTYITFAQADKNGLFSIKENLSEPFIIKVSYLSYFSFEKRLDPKDSSVFDLGNIRMTQINNVLFEVVINEAKAPLKMHGDTIEYDASTFKVPSGSSVEDLLRKLPGIAVAADGSISSQGQGVNKVTVDGKRFFGDDPTMATKNLPAESVSKVQVFNEKTEQEKLTGLTLEKDQKTMNLELKDDFKKGGFGKAVAGIGIEERENSKNTTDPVSKWEAKGNYNKFNKTEQLSFLGIRNNTGRNGINWNDYQDFRGQQNWEWNAAEDLFGFGNGFRWVSVNSDDDSDEFGTLSNYFGDSNAGIPDNSQTGINYNYDNSKVKITGMYTFKENDLFSKAIRNQQFFLSNINYTTDDQSTQDRKNGSHRAELIFEDDIDSSNTLILKFRGNGVFTKTTLTGSFNNTDQYGQANSSQLLNRNTDRDNLGWQGVAYYKRKFKNKKRNLGINFIYNDNERKTDDNLYSKNIFYKLSGDSTYLLDQYIKFNTSIRSIKSSLFYVEPISKDFSLQFFYNFIQRNDNLVRDVFDNFGDTMKINNLYSRDNDHTFKLNKAGTILQYGKNGINISAGIATQNIRLIGQFQEGLNPFTILDRSFDNITSTFSTYIQFAENKRLGFGYTGSVQEPSFKNLSPIVDNSNPMFIRIGNPELNPEESHQINLNYYASNQSRFISYNMGVYATFYKNRNIAEQTIDTFLVTTTRVINYKGGQRINGYAGYGFPFIKNKFTVRVSYNYSYDLSKSIINLVLNDAVTNSHGLSLNFALTPNDLYSIYLDNNLNYAETFYSIDTRQNYKVWNQSYNLQTNTKLLFNVYFNGSLNYRIYNNARFATQYNVPILNASIYKLLLRGDKLELRFSVYDLLNKNISINQSASVNKFLEVRTTLLARYYLLSLSYNIKGIKATVKKSNEFVF